MFSEFESKFRRGTLEEARALFQSLLQDARLNDADLGLTHHWMGLAEYRAGNHHAALAHARVAEQYANQAGDVVLLDKIVLNMVEYLRLTDDAPGALATGRRWLEVFPSTRLGEHRRAAMLFNLGVVHRSRGETETAIYCYEMAIRALRRFCLESGDEQEQNKARLYQIMACQNSAWLFYETGDIPRGNSYAGEAQGLLTPADAVLSREQQLLLVVREFHAGHVEDAMQKAGEFCTGTGDTARQRFFAFWVRGMTSVRMGQKEAGADAAEQAIYEANQVKDARLILLAGLLKSRSLAL